MSILPTSSLSLQNNNYLSFSKSLTPQTHLFLHTRVSPKPLTPKPMFIRMGGGPRTFPGGVSKWQWKRMQAKKAKQLLKARLCRERQIYEMRKRAELKAAVSELERPWEVVEKPPHLFSVSADEQVKVLADRFQRPGGFDLWSERDGPQLFHTMEDLPSARFFPKGVVHSVRPYKRVSSEELDNRDKGFKELGDGNVSNDGLSSSLDKSLELMNVNGQDWRKGNGKLRRNRRKTGVDGRQGGHSSTMRDGENGYDRRNGALKLNGPGDREGGVDRRQRGQSPRMSGGENGYDRRNGGAKSNGLEPREGGRDRRQRGQGRTMRSAENWNRRKGSESEVFDMRLQQDGSYELQ